MTLAASSPIEPPLAKWADPLWTAKGEPRACVALGQLKTLWVNTGTLCNIACKGCYIESSPTNDALAYLEPADLAPFLAELDAQGLGAIEIGFTGGEPFLNPHAIALIEMALAAGHRALVLTNAMRPMRRPRVAAGLIALKERFGARLTLRVSLDHYEPGPHDAERGEGSYADALEGLVWLAREGFAVAVAGRTSFAASQAQARAGFARLFAAHAIAIDADDPAALVLFPEMEASRDAPEITTACWSLLGKDPSSVMCASSRMIVKRRGAARAVVLPCTLLPYDPRFELGETLAQANRPVALNHVFCAQFCVLGGASCSPA